PTKRSERATSFRRLRRCGNELLPGAIRMHLAELAVHLGKNAIVGLVTRTLFGVEPEAHDDQLEVREPRPREIGDGLTVSHGGDEPVHAASCFRLVWRRGESEPLFRDRHLERLVPHAEAEVMDLVDYEQVELTTESRHVPISTLERRDGDRLDALLAVSETA